MLRRAPLLVLTLFLGCLTTRDRCDDARPNVVLILADDVGVEAFGCYGGESYATTRIDALARSGARFTHCYSQPLCTPSRVKLLTGRGNLRNYQRFSYLDPAERTIAHLAREAGYATCVVGKWQLYGAEHYGEWAGKGAHPREAGFDSWCLWQLSVLGSRYADPTLEVDGAPPRELPGRYGPEVFTEHLLEFASEHADQPFFVFYPMALVHGPFEPTPCSRPGELTRQEAFADMVSTMDTLVGRIEDGLEALGLRERTLLLFTSDNGTSTKIRSRRHGREVYGGKGLSVARGIHVPLIASWPEGIPAGSVIGDLVDLSDFLPTLAEAMGVELSGRDEPVLDGRSFLPRLLGLPGDPRSALTIYSNPRPGTGRNPRYRFAFDHGYKLYDDGRFYDLVRDPEEQRPLAAHELDAEARRRRAFLEEELGRMPAEPEHLRAGEDADSRAEVEARDAAGPHSQRGGRP
jgi:arylsulfatase A